MDIVNAQKKSILPICMGYFFLTDHYNWRVQYFGETFVFLDDCLEDGRADVIFFNDRRRRYSELEFCLRGVLYTARPHVIQRQLVVFKSSIVVKPSFVVLINNLEHKNVMYA